MNKFKVLLALCLLLGIANGIAGIGGPYTDPNDGTINDTANRLLWRKCTMGRGSAGMNYTDCGNVTGGQTSNWTTALSYCRNLGTLLGDGRQWRLPSVKELISIVDYRVTTLPIINSTLFPNTNGGKHWTSTNSFAMGNSPTISSNGNNENDPKQYVASVENVEQHYKIPEGTSYRSMAYIVDFAVGGVVEYPKSNTNGYVRCVTSY
ncbi:DUF1566 domain-containing protein [Leptospira adleri]|uniref:Lcl C-terminal domain-containing protein n=1 Tax=Leptospira adleri TaxID=2023186 RepID=A0A2M9YJM8_9LEPT|nr:DUF1566 domain-containing protein [Leptospira adleri]PJZ51737.1 hypothetical protein CH380_18510 [Leptospira adleri]PJZ60624.1 hypothetical protein CH376_17415 [Leptospira adleri]